MESAIEAQNPPLDAISNEVMDLSLQDDWERDRRQIHPTDGNETAGESPARSRARRHAVRWRWPRTENSLGRTGTATAVPVEPLGTAGWRQEARAPRDRSGRGRSR